MKRILPVVLLAITAALPDDALARRSLDPLRGLPKSELQVVTESGRHDFRVWIAADDRSRERGLMYLRRLPADHGMLFLFERPQHAAFWMKNTYLSLDLVFILADGRVLNVAHEATPLSLDPIASAGPVKAVLELVGGTAARIGLTAGSRILHPALRAQSPSTTPYTEARRRSVPSPNL